MPRRDDYAPRDADNREPPLREAEKPDVVDAATSGAEIARTAPVSPPAKPGEMTPLERAASLMPLPRLT